MQQRHAAAFHQTQCWDMITGPACLLQVRLFNGSALANMRMGRFDEAEQALQEALEKDPKSADTLANLITVSLHLGKPVSRHSKWVTPVTESDFCMNECSAMSWLHYCQYAPAGGAPCRHFLSWMISCLAS